MKVYIDGEEVTVNNDIKVIRSSYGVKDDVDAEDHLTITHEGVIVDCISKGEVIKTNSIENYDFFEILFG